MLLKEGDQKWAPASSIEGLFAGVPAPEAGLAMRLLQEIKKTCLSMGRHAAGMVRYAGALWARRSAGDKARAAVLALGERAYQAGLGEPPQRAQIASLDNQLHMARAGNEPIEALLHERAKLLTQVAGQVMAQQPPPGEVADAVNRVKQDGAAAGQQGTGLRETRAAVFPGDRATRLRLAVGYGTVAVCALVLVLLLSRGSGLRQESEFATGPGEPAQAPGGPKGDPPREALIASSSKKAAEVKATFELPPVDEGTEKAPGHPPPSPQPGPVPVEEQGGKKPPPPALSPKDAPAKEPAAPQEPSAVKEPAQEKVKEETGLVHEISPGGAEGVCLLTIDVVKEGKFYELGAWLREYTEFYAGGKKVTLDAIHRGDLVTFRYIYNEKSVCTLKQVTVLKPAAQAKKEQREFKEGWQKQEEERRAQERAEKRAQKLPYAALKVGAQGVPTGINLRVVQVIDDDRMIVVLYPTRGPGSRAAFLSGFPTADLVDGQQLGSNWGRLTGGDPVIVAGTTRYETVDGGSRTVLRIEPLRE
jgi:hypothetical protein